jgi:hypothetical protein
MIAPIVMPSGPPQVAPGVAQSAVTTMDWNMG